MIQVMLLRHVNNKVGDVSKRLFTAKVIEVLITQIAKTSEK